MKSYAVSVDITMSKIIYVDAENQEEAVKKVNDGFNKNPYDYTSHFDAYVSHEITDVSDE